MVKEVNTNDSIKIMNLIDNDIRTYHKVPPLGVEPSPSVFQTVVPHRANSSGKIDSVMPYSSLHQFSVGSI